MKVLFSDPDPLRRERAGRAIERFGYRCHTVADINQAIRTLALVAPDIVIGPTGVDDQDGINLCRAVRARGDRYTYLILMSEPGEQAAGSDAMQAGADDRLTLPLDDVELHVRLQVAERVLLLHRDLTDRRADVERLTQALRASSRTDPLTNLGNHVQLREDLDLFQGQLTRYGHRYAAAICDIDRFGAYNETYGRLAGDEALRSFAQTISQQVRTGDRAYRSGGAEFILLLPEQTLESARIAVERLREALEAQALPDAGNPPWNVVTISAGIAAFTPSSTGTYDALLSDASAALRRAKAGGGNRVASSEHGAAEPASG
ncbi:MAG: diguanylate cyclase [Chloroflexi bacterium]|nr:diguanylate cyclase [Chloroflexota bacterium]